MLASTGCSARCVNGRERADRLHLVAEELDAKRLASGGREDVDDAAADGELPAVVDAVDAVVAGERKQLRERFDADLEPGSELDRRRPRARRRERLRERAGRRAHEPAALEERQRSRSFSDEVRRRLETGLPRHAAARQEADLLVAEEPRGGLGRVARVGVLRQEADERTLEPLVERGEQHGQGRLRDAGARRQRLGQLLEALRVRDLADECVQYRTVHANGGTGRFRARASYSRPPGREWPRSLRSSA